MYENCVEADDGVLCSQGHAEGDQAGPLFYCLVDAFVVNRHSLQIYIGNGKLVPVHIESYLLFVNGCGTGSFTHQI